MERMIGGTLLTGGRDLGSKENYALLMRDGLIVDVAPAETLRRAHPRVDCDFDANRLIVPGFIDAHDHGRGLSPFRFGVRDCALELWIPQLRRICAPAAQAAYYDGLRLAAAGVTTVVHCHNIVDGDRLSDELVETARAYNKAGIRVALCPPFTDQNSLIYADRTAFADMLAPGLKADFLKMICDRPIGLSEYCDLLDELRKCLAQEIASGMVAVQVCPVGVQWCGDKALTDLADYAKQHRTSVHMHMLETKYQRVYAHRQWGKSTVNHLQEIGFLGPHLTCAHTVWAEDGELDLLAEAGVTLVTNPSSNLRLRSGVMPLASAVERGLVCGVGLDGCGLDDDQDYCRELRMAYLNAERSGVDAASELSCEHILQMSYAGGGRAAGGALSAGRLEPGGRADFVCFDLNRLRAPYCDEDVTPAELIVQLGSKDKITEVYCAGKRIVADGNADMVETAGKDLSDAVRRAIAIGRAPLPSEGLKRAIASFYRQWERAEEDENSGHFTDTRA
ncbi:MAG: amidohydrolase family protein [Clostridiales Family XIII bacterium]|jgi:cytosine/adenosine deaminase-related metal-dependent hydrolase|nr:amidohydrolase family protein [Clostridiales Family XIII bacterium]